MDESIDWDGKTVGYYVKMGLGLSSETSMKRLTSSAN